MQVKKLISQKAAILTLKGNFLFEPDKLKLREELHSLLEHDIKTVIVDLGELDCINSEGLGTLVMGLTSLRKAGADLRLAHVGDAVYHILTVTRLVEVFDIYETVDQALASHKIQKK